MFSTECLDFRFGSWSLYYTILLLFVTVDSFCRQRYTTSVRILSQFLPMEVTMFEILLEVLTAPWQHILGAGFCFVFIAAFTIVSTVVILWAMELRDHIQRRRHV